MKQGQQLIKNKLGRNCLAVLKLLGQYQNCPNVKLVKTGRQIAELLFGRQFLVGSLWDCFSGCQNAQCVPLGILRLRIPLRLAIADILKDSLSRVRKSISLKVCSLKTCTLKD